MHEEVIKRLNDNLEKKQITSISIDADIEPNEQGELQYTGKLTYTIEVDKNKG
jgi:hypothetical protein